MLEHLAVQGIGVGVDGLGPDLYFRVEG